MSAEELAEVYTKVKKGGREAVESSQWSRSVKVVGSLTPKEVVDFQQMWLSPDVEARQFVLGEKPTKGGRRRRGTPKKGAKDADAEEPLVLGSTNSVLTMKHLLSDLWRTFDFTRKWNWIDQERTRGSGNATHASWNRTRILTLTKQQ